MNRGGTKREGDTESEAGLRLRAVSTEPDTGLKLQNCKIMTWAKVERLTDWATQVPLFKKFLMFIYFWPRERDRAWAGRGIEREREIGRHKIQSRLQALSCQHRAWHEARTHGVQDQDLSRCRTLNQLSHPGTPFFFFKFFLTFIYFWETEHKWGRGREREGDTESEAGSKLSCQHRAQCGTWTHEL